VAATESDSRFFPDPKEQFSEPTGGNFVRATRTGFLLTFAVGCFGVAGAVADQETASSSAAFPYRTNYEEVQFIGTEELAERQPNDRSPITS